MAIPDVALGQTFAKVARITQKSPQDVLPRSSDYAAAFNETDTPNTEIKVEISSFSSNSLQLFNAHFNSVLKGIRIADQAMEAVQSKIGQMHSEVQAFLKTYPPYPPGSEERIAALKTIAGIRQQIERLTLPVDHLAGLILGKKIESTGEYEIRDNGKTVGQSDRRHAFHNPSGLDIPELTLDASDQQIAGIKGRLEKASAMVARSRVDLAEATRKLIDDI